MPQIFLNQQIILGAMRKFIFSITQDHGRYKTIDYKLGDSRKDGQQWKQYVKNGDTADTVRQTAKPAANPDLEPRLYYGNEGVGVLFGFGKKSGESKITEQFISCFGCSYHEPERDILIFRNLNISQLFLFMNATIHQQIPQGLLTDVYQQFILDRTTIDCSVNQIKTSLAYVIDELYDKARAN